MSLDLSNYDFYVRKGDTLRYTFLYKNTAGAGIDLTNYVGSMHIRRSPYYDKLIGELNESYPTGSFGRGISGDFQSGSGITGFTGGIILNNGGITGSIYLEVDSETCFGMPVGKHSYDLQLFNPDTSTLSTILRGRFEVMDAALYIKREEAQISGGDIEEVI